jgi:hypothetical protein
VRSALDLVRQDGYVALADPHGTPEQLREYWGQAWRLSALRRLNG